MDTVFTLEELFSVRGWARIYDIVTTDFGWSENSFLSSLPVIIVSLVGYVIFVYGLNCLLSRLGVEKPKAGSVYGALMKFFSMAHNLNMMLISALCFIAIAIEAWLVILQSDNASTGFYNVLCDPEHKHNTGKITFWIYVYYLSKFVEFFDTVLIVLRRSDLRFIHTYHHVATMAISYATLYFKGTGPWVVILLNTFVHVVMYYYYLLNSLGVKDVWWKNYLTDLQLSQFVLDSFFIVAYIYFDITFEMPKGNHCAGWLPGAFFGLVIIVSYFFLFLSLRLKNAKAQKNAMEQKQKEKEVEKKLN